MRSFSSSERRRLLDRRRVGRYAPAHRFLSQQLGTVQAPGLVQPATKQKQARKPRRTPGRPTVEESEALRERIVSAAIDVFCREGFEGASVSHIAEIAGVTKPTVYRLYNSKEDLFKLAIRSALSSMRPARLTLDDVASPTEVVAHAADVISRGYVTGKVRELWHSVLSAKHRLPEFHDEIVEILREGSIASRLALYFEKLHETGDFHIPNPVATAHNFSLLVGQGRELGLPRDATPEMEAERVEQIVRMFVEGHRAGRPNHGNNTRR